MWALGLCGCETLSAMEQKLAELGYLMVLTFHNYYLKSIETVI